MSAHTPGPWKLWAAQDARPHSISLGGMLGSIEVRHHHCDFHDPSGALAKEQLANARLIASAPDLLEALDKIACFAPGHGDACEIIAKVARAAIAKATGEAA
jgi:hypothetical protein